MTTLQLEYFQYLAQSLHLSHTAEHFYVSAPAVAASIKRLEAELSAELFEVQGRALKLTDAGKIFSQYVDVILSNISSAKEEISILEQKKEDTITIAIVSPVIWSQMFQDFMWRYPDIKINSTLVSVSQLHDPSVMQGFDFIFCPSSDLTSPAFDTIELPSNNAPCLAVYKSHPFSGRKSIRLIEAKNERFIALSRGYSYREYFDTLCKLAGFEPNIVLECDFQIRAAMLAAEYGILVTTKNVEERNVLGDVCYIDIVDPLFARTLLFSRKRNTKNKKAIEIFTRFVLNYYGITENFNEVL